MSYLLDKKIRKKKFLNAVFFVIILCILFYFRSGIWNGFARAGHRIFSPIMTTGDRLAGDIAGLGSYFASKHSLYLENKNLKSALNQEKIAILNYNSVLAENLELKDILGRIAPKNNMVLGAILSKPNQSPYDTLVIDVGAESGLTNGDTVFAIGNIPIGRIAEAFSSSSKVILFSSAGEKTQVIIAKNIFMEILGRGGGNFEMILPRDFVLSKGDQAVLPGIIPYVLGVVETIVSDSRDPFIKALLVSPVNIQELKFVEVKPAK